MKSWYVIHTKPRQESVAEENLQRQGFETYLPRIKRAVRRRNTWRDNIEPLFPRYLFLHIDPGQQTVAPVRSTLGVTTIVTFGNRIVPVPDGTIDTLRRHENGQTGLQQPPQQSLQKGDAVVVTAGPFEGIEGIFQMSSGQERVSVLLDILGQATRVILNRHDVSRTDSKLVATPPSPARRSLV